MLQTWASQNGMAMFVTWANFHGRVHHVTNMGSPLWSHRGVLINSVIPEWDGHVCNMGKFLGSLLLAWANFLPPPITG